MESQGRVPTPEGGQKDSISSEGNEFEELYRRVTYISHSPGDEKGCGDVSPKGHKKGCRLCLAKADGCCCRLSGSAEGVVHPFPRRAERQRHEWHLFLMRGRYTGGCVLLCNKVRHTHFSSF